MHHFHPPAPKSCTVNQQLSSLTACQYLPCSSVAIHKEKEGIEMLHMGGFVTHVGVTSFSAAYGWRWPPFLHLYIEDMVLLLWYLDLMCGYFFLCALGTCLSMLIAAFWGSCLCPASSKDWPVSERSQVMPWVFTVGLSQVKAWVSKPKYCIMCAAQQH